MIDGHKDEWLSTLKKEIKEGEYNPNKCRTIAVPKSGWTVRPGGILRIKDTVVYSALVLDIYEDIQKEIEWSAESRRYSRILLEDKSERGWIEYPTSKWKAWNDDSKELLDEYDYVVFTDVASFFDNIELQILYSDLNQLSIDSDVKKQLMKCLRRWAEPRDRGIPQGYYPSDILSELYMNRIDEKLKLEGFVHNRYSDNLRIFCETRREAKEALWTLTEKYRQRGLNLQRHKTEIVDADEATRRLKAPVREIRQLQSNRFENTVTTETTHGIRRKRGGDPYYGDEKKGSGSVQTDGGERFGENVDEPEVDEEELVKAFHQNFTGESSGGFKQHLFRFIITRLGMYDNDAAVDYCIKRIEEGKTEIRQVLTRYFSRLSNKQSIAGRLANLIDNSKVLYPFHEFLIIRWLWEEDIQSDTVLQVVRKRLASRDIAKETKHYAIAYVGENGTKVDTEEILGLYEDEYDQVTRAIIICSIRNMEKSMRNSVYRKAEGDSQICEFAVQYAKEIS